MPGAEARVELHIRCDFPSEDNAFLIRPRRRNWASDADFPVSIHNAYVNGTILQFTATIVMDMALRFGSLTYSGR